MNSDADFPDEEAMVSILIDRGGRVKVKSLKSARAMLKKGKPAPKKCEVIDSGAVWWVLSNPKMIIQYVTPSGELRYVEVEVP